MRFSRNWFLPLVLLSLVGVTFQTGKLAPDFIANGERVQALHVLLNFVQDDSVDELAWETGWSSLCGSATQPPSSKISQEALSFVAHTRMERGDYAGALAEFRRVVAEGETADAALASAYVAALEMRWLDAAKLLYPSEPMLRHQRFWATVFYLAAQQLMFRGQADQAAEWYRKADQGYGTQGPLLGLSLVDCLMQAGRPLEAFDAYRRALVVLPVEEALTHRTHFEQMRLDALRAWRKLDPANPHVAGWLDFYGRDRPIEEKEVSVNDPRPSVMITEDLGGGRMLVGFDYRQEDIETGPFMWVDLYLQEFVEGNERLIHRRELVLNQAPNGAFAWDAAPDGVRPFGWHGNLYSTESRGIEFQDIARQKHWLCMNGGKLKTAIGLESLSVPIAFGQLGYIQGGRGYFTGDPVFGFGRYWFRDVVGVNPQSNVRGTFPPGEMFDVQGSWKPGANLERVALWFYSGATSRACAQSVFLFALPGA